MNKTLANHVRWRLSGFSLINTAVLCQREDLGSMPGPGYFLSLWYFIIQSSMEFFEVDVFILHLNISFLLALEYLVNRAFNILTAYNFKFSIFVCTTYFSEFNNFLCCLVFFLLIILFVYS